MAKFATCQPYKSGTACVLKDAAPTYSFEVSMIAPDSASVLVQQYYMVYKDCLLGQPLDPPVIGSVPRRSTWVYRARQWSSVGPDESKAC
jgi:hypothetical protein